MNKMRNRQPAYFLGHGTPMNALADNTYTQAWARIGASNARPKGILAISAHWYIPATQVTAMAAPRTIHDFQGFPQALFDYQYPAPGNPALAKRIVQLLRPLNAGLDEQGWGLDHGTWGVLCHMYPAADIPVLQLSIDSTREPAFHYQLGKKLRPLREEGIMVVATGNIVHNLSQFVRGKPDIPPQDWALRFEQSIRQGIQNGRHDILIDYQALGPDAQLACPTAEHYLPLLYVMGLQDEADRVSFPVEGVDGGSISMLSVCVSD